MRMVPSTGWRRAPNLELMRAYAMGMRMKFFFSGRPAAVKYSGLPPGRVNRKPEYSLPSTVKVAACTRGEHGAVIVGDGETHLIPAEPAVQVVDTTGAGDLFAAGFLAGWTRGRNLHDCGRMGAVAAAEVISHLGARPEADLAALVAERVPA